MTTNLTTHSNEWLNNLTEEELLEYQQDLLDEIGEESLGKD